VLPHAAFDVDFDGLTDATRRYNTSSAVSIHMRSREQVTRFFAGLEILAPGVVPLGHWRPGPPDREPGRALPTYTAVGRKP
jgi:hypothetical protein